MVGGARRALTLERCVKTGGSARSEDRGDAPWIVSCDFDGTITCQDMVQAMLTRFADAAWRDIEAEWEGGLIGSRECLARQTALLRVSEVELARWVDQQPLDPHVTDFFADCVRLGLDVRVVSDGYDWVIRRVLSRLGVAEVPIFANQLRSLHDGRWALSFPHAREGCASGACKCVAVGSDRRRLHIGDGRSDFCVSNICDLVLAKGALLATRRAQGQACIPFETFAEVRAVLETRIVQGGGGETVALRSAAG